MSARTPAELADELEARGELAGLDDFPELADPGTPTLVDDPERLADEPAVDPSSGWARLEARYDAEAERTLEDERLVLDVDDRGEPVLCCRYRWVNPSRTERLAKQAAKMLPGSEQALFVAAATLALCCDEVGFRHPATDELVSHPQGAVRYDKRLAAALGLRLRSGENAVVQTVLHAFGGNDWAVVQQARAVEAWLANPNQRVAEGFLGG